MIVHLTLPGTLELRDRDDFKRFKVQVAGGRQDLEAVRAAFGDTVRFEDAETAWVGIEALRSRPDVAGDEAWQSSFDAMVEAAAPYGWTDERKENIKAHVEWERG